MRKHDVTANEALEVRSSADGVIGLLHGGRDLSARWVRKDPAAGEPEWTTLSAEYLIYLVRGGLRVELRERSDEAVELAAGQCCVVPPHVPFRAVCWPPGAGEAALFLGVSTAGVEGSDKKVDPAVVSAIGDVDRADLKALLDRRWGGATIVTRARIHDATKLPGFIAREGDRLLGAITLSAEGHDCEVVTFDSLDEGRGVGAALLQRAEEWAREQGCDRLWLVTTNDNLRAIGFYQRRGFRILAVHPDAVTRSRELKPDIPERGQGGVPVVDEIELERQL